MPLLRLEAWRSCVAIAVRVHGVMWPEERFQCAMDNCCVEDALGKHRHGGKYVVTQPRTVRCAYRVHGGEDLFVQRARSWVRNEVKKPLRDELLHLHGTE